MDMTRFAGNSKWLKAEDLHERKLTRAVFRITDVTTGTFTNFNQQEVEQPILHFDSTTKQFGLNPTNVTSMILLYGPDSDGWMGKRIIVYTDKVMVRGELKDCLRIDTNQATKQLAAQPIAGNGSPAALTPSHPPVASFKKHTYPIHKSGGADIMGTAEPDLDEDIPF